MDMGLLDQSSGFLAVDLHEFEASCMFFLSQCEDMNAQGASIRKSNCFGEFTCDLEPFLFGKPNDFLVELEGFLDVGDDDTDVNCLFCEIGLLRFLRLS